MISSIRVEGVFCIMSKDEVIDQIRMWQRKFAESDNSATKLSIEGYELSPLYRLLGKIIADELAEKTDLGARNG